MNNRYDSFVHAAMFIQLTELEYSGREKDGKVAITVERHVPIATSVTVMVVAQNYTSFSKSGKPLPADIPVDLSLFKGASSKIFCTEIS